MRSHDERDDDYEQRGDGRRPDRSRCAAGRLRQPSRIGRLFNHAAGSSPRGYRDAYGPAERLARPRTVVRDFRAGGKLLQRPKRQPVDLDVAGIVQVEITGRAFDEDDVRDGGLREPKDDELVVSGGKGTCSLALGRSDSSSRRSSLAPLRPAADYPAQY